MTRMELFEQQTLAKRRGVEEKRLGGRNMQ
jgi:hypothetical protein